MASKPVAPKSVTAPTANYALGTSTWYANQWLHTAGIGPVGTDGSVPDDIGKQAAAVWTTLRALLSEVKMTTNDVVSITTYVVSGNDVGPVMAARDSALGRHKCASTLVYVPALVNDSWKVEIALVAAQ